ncbi:hypothetical protein Tco_0518537, partial [Tanacetum coccineum]
MPISYMNPTNANVAHVEEETEVKGRLALRLGGRCGGGGGGGGCGRGGGGHGGGGGRGDGVVGVVAVMGVGA